MIKFLAVIIGVVLLFFLSAALMCLDAWIVGHVAAHIYTLLIFPTTEGLPALTWTAFAGISALVSAMTLSNRLANVKMSEGSKRDTAEVFIEEIVKTTIKIFALGVIYVVVGWIA